MKIDKRLYILLLCALSFFIANAAVTFKAQQPGTIIEGDRFQITFTLEGAQGENFNGPQLNNCELLSDHNVSSSTSVTIINGKRTDSYRYDYICVYHAKNAGKVNLAETEANIRNSNFEEVKEIIPGINLLTIELNDGSKIEIPGVNGNAQLNEYGFYYDVYYVCYDYFTNNSSTDFAKAKLLEDGTYIGRAVYEIYDLDKNFIGQTAARLEITVVSLLYSIYRKYQRRTSE